MSKFSRGAPTEAGLPGIAEKIDQYFALVQISVCTDGLVAELQFSQFFRRGRVGGGLARVPNYYEKVFKSVQKTYICE